MKYLIWIRYCKTRI